MVSTADPVVCIQHSLHPPRGPVSDAAAVPRARTEIRTPAAACALRMGGTSEERPVQDRVPQRTSRSGSLTLPAEHGAPQGRLQPGCITQHACEPTSSSDAASTAHRTGHVASLASDDCGQPIRQRCSSYDASLDRSEHRPTKGSDGVVDRVPTTLFRRSMGNIPHPTLPFPATRQQKQAAITALKKPLQVVTKEKSLIRYTTEGRRYWRWKDVVARVLHICRGASADDYSLLLQTEHWLEACDYKHRYGSNLKPYFKVWLVSDTHQSFFKWLDEGEGMHLDIPERPRKKLDLERVVYCGIERCFFEVGIDKGLFRYQLSKHLVTTDSARNAPPCPPDLGKTMDSIRQSTMRSGRMLSPRASGVMRAHREGPSSHEAAASASLPASPLAGVGHGGFSAPLGAAADSQQHDASGRNGASGCSLSDDLQQCSGRAQSPAERAATVMLEEAVPSKGAESGIAGRDAGVMEVRRQSVTTPPRIHNRGSASGVDGANLDPPQSEASDATVQHLSPAPGTPPLGGCGEAGGRRSEESGTPLTASARHGSVRPSQRTPGLLSQELRKVAGNPHAQLGDEVGTHIATMHQSTVFSCPSGSSPSAVTTSAPVAVPSKRPPALGAPSRTEDTPSARAPLSTGASQSGAAAQQEQEQEPPVATSPNDMEDYLHWAFGRTPAQILQRPIMTGHPPVYTEDQHAGGWLDVAGKLNMRQHGVNSLPSGLTRFPSLTLLTTQRCHRADLHCTHSDEDTESLAYGHSIGGSSDASGGSPVFSCAHHMRQHTLPASVSAHSMRSPVTASGSIPPLPRGFPSMPRLGSDQEGLAATQRFPALWTLRFPNSSTPDGTVASASGGSCSHHGPGQGAGSMRLSSRLGSCCHDSLGPLPSLDSGAWKEGRSTLPRRMSDSDGNVFQEAHALNLLSAGMHMATIGPHMRTASVGTAKELQVRRLRSSLDSRVDVSHPRLVSNSAIPVNLKLLDIVETVAAPGGASSVASAPQAGSYSNDAGEHIGAEGASGSVEPEVRDLADMLEERMERTGQLVKVRTQAQLEDLLPCAPKVLGRDRGASDAASGDILHSARAASQADSRDLPSLPSARSGRLHTSNLQLPTQPSLGAAAASGAANQQEAGNSLGPQAASPSLLLARKTSTSFRGSPGVVGDAAQGSEQPAAASSGAAPSWELLADPAAAPAPRASATATFSRISAAAAAASVGMTQAPTAGVGAKEGATPAKDPAALPEKAREKWIYVWDMHSRLYINRKMPGRFHHSSFVAGGAVKAAGSIVVEDGMLKQITTWSGHYRPRESDISAFLEWLRSKGVHMETVELLVVKPHKPHKAPKGSQHQPPPPPLVPQQAAAAGAGF